MKRRTFLALIAAAGATGLAAENARAATLYKNPQCGCCHEHAAYLRSHGYRVTEIETHDLEALRQRHGVPEPLYGCHLILVGGYVIEGHVSASLMERLLRERPNIRGISLPGMPTGSPGMTGKKTAPFRIYEIALRPSGEPRLYAIE